MENQLKPPPRVVDRIGEIPRRSNRRGRRQRMKPAWALFLWIYALVSLYPLVWVLMQSLRPDLDFLTDPWSIPAFQDLTFEPYPSAWSIARMADYFANSAIVSAATVALVLILSIGSGYALSRLKFKGYQAVYVATMLMMAVPAAVIFLPLFIVANDLGILDSYLGLILPYTTFSLPLGVYLMKANFDSLPSELFEAARVDGCSEWQVFWKVILPLAPGGIATVGLLTFMGVWDEYIWALVSVRSQALFTLPLGLVTLDQNKFQYGYNVSFAGMVITAMPVILALLVSQRGFLKAVTAGAIKG